MRLGQSQSVRLGRSWSARLPVQALRRRAMFAPGPLSFGVRGGGGAAAAVRSVRRFRASSRAPRQAAGKTRPARPRRSAGASATRTRTLRAAPPAWRRRVRQGLSSTSSPSHTNRARPLTTRNSPPARRNLVVLDDEHLGRVRLPGVDPERLDPEVAANGVRPPVVERAAVALPHPLLRLDRGRCTLPQRRLFLLGRELEPGYRNLAARRDVLEADRHPASVDQAANGEPGPLGRRLRRPRRGFARRRRRARAPFASGLRACGRPWRGGTRPSSG